MAGPGRVMILTKHTVVSSNMRKHEPFDWTRKDFQKRSNNDKRLLEEAFGIDVPFVAPQRPSAKVCHFMLVRSGVRSQQYSLRLLANQGEGLCL